MDETLARLWEDLLGRVGGPLTSPYISRFGHGQL